MGGLFRPPFFYAQVSCSGIANAFLARHRHFLGAGETFTDPAVVSVDVGRFGYTDTGLKGIRDFFKNHKCNEVCRALGLTPVHGPIPDNVRWEHVPHPIGSCPPPDPTSAVTSKRPAARQSPPTSALVPRADAAPASPAVSSLSLLDPKGPTGTAITAGGGRAIPQNTIGVAKFEGQTWDKEAGRSGRPPAAQGPGATEAHSAVGGDGDKPLDPIPWAEIDALWCTPLAELRYAVA